MAIQPNTIVRLNDYCLVEFFPEQLTMSPSPVFYKLYNSQTGTHQIFNGNGSPTGNSQDYTVTYIGPNQYAYLNQEVVMPYWQRFPEKFLYTTPGAYDTFNKVRFHFISGYDFGSLPGLILSLKNKMNNGSYDFFMQMLVTPDWFTDLVKNNPSPIYLADAMFDRYVEVFVPAEQLINQDYYNQPPESRSGEFGALITYNGTSYSGLIQDAPMTASIDECVRIDRQTISEDIYDVYTTDQHYESVMSIDSLHQRFGAFIGESTEFDALEFYGTMVDDSGNLTFAESMINLLSTNAHDIWVIAHQLTIHEWIDGVKTLSGKYMELQETGFDGPMYYRPILKNSGNSIAFEIDYTCRLFNRRNGDQIIRLGSYISYNAAKYGRTLSTLPIIAPVDSHIVYNKIVKSSLEATELFVEQNYLTTGNGITKNIAQGINSTAFMPMFFNVNSISVSTKDAIPANDNSGTTLIYKQGDLRFILMPFDNMLKFKVYTVNQNGKLKVMDLSGFGDFRIVLMMNNKKTRFKYLTDIGTSNPKVGELMFKIPQKDSESLVTSSTREFYITMLSKDSTETVLYSGFWNDVTEKDIVEENITKVKAQQAEILSGSTSPFSSIASILVNGINTIKANAQMMSSENLQINIPGYVSVGNKNNDVSIINQLIPAGYTPSTNAAQSKADSALGKTLGNQAGGSITK